MLADTPTARGPHAAIHAMVAVVLALVVSAAAPLSGGASENTLAAIRLVHGTGCPGMVASQTAWQLMGVAPARDAEPVCDPATRLVRARERDCWRAALPPPADAA